MKFNKETVIQLYVEYNVPADRLVSNPRLLFRFTSDYATRIGEKVPASDLGQAILNLRKRGEDNGGLPKLRRQYFGRKNILKEPA